MPNLKAYTLGINGMPGHHVIKALGLESWIRQCEVTPVERSKAAAHRLLEARGVFISLSDSEFHLTDSPYVNAMRDAGLLDEPAVYARAYLGGGRVVRLNEPHREPTFVGTLERVDGRIVFASALTEES